MIPLVFLTFFLFTFPLLVVGSGGGGGGERWETENHLCLRSANAVLVLDKNNSFSPVHLVSASSPLVSLCGRSSFSSSLPIFPSLKTQLGERESPPLWFVAFETKETHIQVDSHHFGGNRQPFHLWRGREGKKREWAKGEGEREGVSLFWMDVHVTNFSIFFDVHLLLTPKKEGGKGDAGGFDITFQLKNVRGRVGEEVGVFWGIGISLGVVWREDDRRFPFQNGKRSEIGKMKIVQNRGVGALHSCNIYSTDSLCFKGFKTPYIDAPFSFIAHYEENLPYSGLYIGAHDRNANSKHFIYSGMSSNPEFVIKVPVAMEVRNGDLSFESSFKPIFPIQIALFDGDWYDASQIYRNWVFSEPTKWLEGGPILKRKWEGIKWAHNLNFWLNSHWNPGDLTVKDGGDPLALSSRILNFNKYLKPEGGLGLHWYEWDTLGFQVGSNYTNCSTKKCGFDTHYPNYFPPRVNFQEKVKEMQRNDIKIIPYLNGRLYDTKLETFPQALPFASKKGKNSHSSSLRSLKESYGSSEMAVMCPYTRFWQKKLTKLTKSLYQLYQVDGVYLDQVGAKGGDLCHDQTHGHEIGGGNHTVEGYLVLMETIRDLTAGNLLLMTEGIAEVYLSHFDLFLSLDAMNESWEGQLQTIPIFPAIYGGYYLATGTYFTASDFSRHTFQAKIARQLIFGFQLGWITFGGNYISPKSYLSPESPRFNSTDFSFLSSLISARSALSPFFLSGRLSRPLPFASPLLMETLGLKEQRFVTRSGSTSSFFIPHLLHSTWVGLEGEWVVVVAVRLFGEKEVDLEINAIEYGLKGAPTECLVTQIVSDSPQKHTQKCTAIRQTLFSQGTTSPARAIKIEPLRG